MFKWIYEGTKTGLVFLVKGAVLHSKTGADFSKKTDYLRYLSPNNKGLLVDGYSLKLSETMSFQNVCVIASPGAGKTTRYIIPNVLEKAKSRCSIVVNDPKGEVFENTSKYMEENGYRVILIDPENIARSSSFNPLLEVQNDIEIEQIAEILIECGNPSKGDTFWNNGAKRFISLFLKCLRIASLDDKATFNLANLYLLLQNFGEDGQALDSWIAINSVLPEEPKNPSLWNEWKGLLTGNKEGILSFVLNAITALKAMANRDLAKITSRSDFELETIRSRKTIIYFVTPPQHIEYYSFFTSLFFRSVFNTCMRQLPKSTDLPVFILYDEFGHSTIPNFVSTANTIRGYRVSLSIVLQSIAQLSARYGKDYAYSIQGGFSTYITYSGSDPETTQLFEKVMGRVRERQKKDFDDVVDQYKEYNLMNANEVRTIKEDQALLVCTNNNPVLLNSKPYFANSKYSRLASKGGIFVSNSNKPSPKLIKL